jgi:hypothetical protein
MQTTNLPTVDPAYSPHNLSTGLWDNFSDQIVVNNLSNFSWNNATGSLIAPFTSTIGTSPFYLLVYGIGMLLVFWRTKGVQIPALYLVIASPVMWQLIPADWRQGMLVMALLGLIGIIYSFIINIKR